MTSFLIFATYFFLLRCCTEMLLGISSKNTKFFGDWLRNDVTVMSSLILRTWFYLSALQRMCCYGNVKHFILLKFCTEILLIIAENKSKFCDDWLRNNVTVTSLLIWMAWFYINAVLRMCCMKNLILLKFSTKVQLSISKIVLRLTEKWFNSDVIIVLEDSMFPKRSSKKVLQCHQQGIYTQTFTFKQIPIYFQEKSPS